MILTFYKYVNMKKILILITSFLLILSSLQYVQAARDTSQSGTVQIRVNEKIPGVNCTPDKAWGVDEKTGTYSPTTYNCYVKKDTSQVLDMLGAIIKWFTYIAILVAVLFIVGSGIMYSMWWANEEMKSTAKKRVVESILWLILLLLSGYILQLVAPWVYK